MVKKILLGAAAVLAVLVIGFVVIVATRPSEFRIARSVAMAAPADRVFEQVNDLHNFAHWSPFSKLDPQMTVSYEGAKSGEGAVHKWSGNSNAGEGSMTIVESKPNELVRMRLDFIRPMKDTAEGVFTLQPEGDKINVTWAMHGKDGFMEKALCMFLDRDKMIGDMFIEGLTSMKQIVEAEPPAVKDEGQKPKDEGQKPKDESATKPA